MISEGDNWSENPPLPMSHTQREKYILTKHSIKNRKFFDLDKIFNNYITNNNKK